MFASRQFHYTYEICKYCAKKKVAFISIMLSLLKLTMKILKHDFFGVLQRRGWPDQYRIVVDVGVRIFDFFADVINE